MALKAFFLFVLVAAVLIGLALPTPNSGKPEPARSQLATLDLGR